MNILVEPVLEVDDIEVEFDEEKQTGDTEMYTYGYKFPLIKINDYLLKITDIDGFSLNIGLNTLPTFSITVDDANFQLREALKKDIDLATIFLGYSTWYIKFKGILTNVQSRVDSNYLYIDGTLFIPKLYDIEQHIYTDMSVQDIIIDICTKVGLGLAVVDCPDLAKTISKVVNPGWQFLRFLSFVIRQYTNCIYSVDAYGFLYVGTIDTFKNEEIGKYSHKKANQGIGDETDIIISSKWLWMDKDGKDKSTEPDLDLNVDDFTHSSNYSAKHLDSFMTYNLIDTKTEELVETSTELGTGDTYYNVFDTFKEHVNPYHDSITNKSLSGNVSSVTLLEPTFELTPFMNIQFDCWIMMSARGDGKDNDYKKDYPHLDEEHSGKRMVINFGYRYTFDNTSKENFNRMRITQQIDML
jgi:hypothetical protein